MSDFLEKPANQNIDVHFFQTRVPAEWKARVEFGGKTYTIGPASMVAIINNVANLVSMEAAYADLKVHGELALAEQAKPLKRGDVLKRHADRAKRKEARGLVGHMEFGADLDAVVNTLDTTEIGKELP